MIKILHITIFIVCSGGIGFSAYAQSILSGIRYQVGAGAYVSDKTPFWLRANQYGLVPLNGPFLTLQGAAYKDYDSTMTAQGRKKMFDIGYGAQAVMNMGKQAQFLLPEAYLKMRYGAFEFYAGRRKEIIGLIDTTLRAGSYIWSGNALPIPKIQLAIPNYVSILGKGLISIKGAFSHGWFGKQPYTEGYYLHQKWLYGKIGRDSWMFNFYGGINHQVQWGGYSESFKNNDILTKNGFFSADPFVFLNVVVPVYWKIPASKEYTQYETLNRFGNHLGSIDIGFSIKTKFADIYFYRQSPYEDGQMPEVILSMDGNYSLSLDLKNKRYISKINFGYLDTRRQAGELTQFAKWLGKKETHYGEVQNYLNHGQYSEGWSYQNNGIGTPLIIANQDLTKDVQASDSQIFTIDNFVQAYYAAATGKIGKYNYLLKSSFTSSSGIFYLPRASRLSQFSSQFSLGIPFAKYNIESKANIGFDSGNLYGNNIGISFFILKKW